MMLSEARDGRRETVKQDPKGAQQDAERKPHFTQ